MNPWKRWLLILGAGILGLNLIMLASSLFGVNFLVNFWWFDSLGYGFYYLQRLFYRYIVLISVTVFFFLIFFLNFWIASRYLGTTAPPQSDDNAQKMAYKDLFQMFRTGSMRVYTPLSILLGVLVAWPLFNHWEKFLLYIFAPAMGVSDPVYGKDISYYLFSYPIYTLLQRRLLLAFALLLAGLALLYWLEKRLLSQQEQTIPHGAKRHLSILILLVFFIEIWDYVLQAYGLLYNPNHQVLFFGPGFVEMWVILPLIGLTLFLLMGTAFSLIFLIHKHRGLKVLGTFVVLFFLALGARYSSLLPNLVEKYIVKPNEISRERPFISRNIEATLAAYNLNEVETRNFNPQRIPTDLDTSTIKAELRNIPVWDGELLEDVFQQMQQLRTYYNFPSVDVGRYTVNSIYQQVFLAARELDHNQLPPGAHNWINQHMSYTHGYGAVMTPASQGGDEPMTWFMYGIPPASEYGFNMEQPAIYFGLGSYEYAIAPNDAGEFDYPKGDSNVMTHYTGRDGVPLASLFKKLLFAYHFMEKDIFFTTKTNKDSKILFRRNIVERIKTLTPYLLLDSDPYLVVTPKNLFWIQDAYVTSALYPNATPYFSATESFNYIRNSVKITVDAYNGTVTYYVFDTKDPIIQAYSRIYPGIFKNQEEMPRELLQQVRYPRDLFDIQMTIYAKYQQQDPEVFYQQEDTWDFAKTYQDEGISRIKPYYLTLDLIDPPRFDFLLLVPMSPKGRDNLRALALVGCDPPNYGKIIIYNFPKGELIYGPPQITALINQDTTIAEQFTLWNQIGSRTALGKMIILPIGKIIIYIQPVYLKASAQLKIPELKRLIMSQGQIVVMERSLEEAYVKLQERIKADIRRIDTRFAPLLPGAPASEEGLSPHVESEQK